VLATMAGCIDQNPTETRDDAKDFAVLANWASTVAPVGTNTVSGQLSAVQTEGYRINVSFNVTGPPNASYQWRIFRENCAATVFSTSVSSPGVFPVATVQSYPDVVLDATGKATITRAIAGLLDSQTAYAVRLRPVQASTNFNGSNPVACGNLQQAP
jgi:hypothetical protein